jgi:replication factor A1
MIKIPFEDIIQKIKDKSGLSEEEIKLKINQKLEKLSGLISEEGAAHIIANELGIKLFETGKLQVKNVLTGMRNVELVGKVKNIFNINEFKRSDGTSGKVGSFIVADETGTMRIVCWGSQADNLAKMKPGDVIKTQSGYVRENNTKQKEVHIGDRGSILINPEGETVDVDINVNNDVAKRKKIKELQENEDNISIVGTIVQIFDPKFYEVCPDCGKRAKPKEDKFVCDVHSEVTPDYSYVFNVFLDDGTENMRIVCFRDQAESLLSKTKEQMMEYKNFPEKFETMKTELLGNIVEFTGRVVKNDMFQRLEFISSNVNTKLDPEEEIKKLNEEVKKVNQEKTE